MYYIMVNLTDVRSNKASNVSRRADRYIDLWSSCATVSQ